MFAQGNLNEIRGTVEGVDIPRALPRVIYLPGHRVTAAQARVAAPASDLLHVPLSLDDLHSGGWISTREGDTERLWVVQLVTPGADREWGKSQCRARRDR